MGLFDSNKPKSKFDIIKRFAKERMEKLKTSDSSFAFQITVSGMDDIDSWDTMMLEGLPESNVVTIVEGYVTYKNQGWDDSRIFNEIENRTILDPELRSKAEHEIFSKSSIIDLKFLSKITYFDPEEKTPYFKKEPYPGPFFTPHFFIERNSMEKVDKYFFYFNVKKLDLRDITRPKNFDKSLIALTNKQKNIEDVGSIKIENEKMVFFHYNFLNKVLEDKEELFFECNNGEFSIKKYGDDAHKENLEKFFILTEELKRIDYFDLIYSNCNKSYPINKKKVATEAKKIIKKFDFNKNQQCFYFIDFNEPK